MSRARRFLGLALAGASLLAGCEIGTDGAATTAVPALARPEEPLVATPSGASAELADYYGRVQNGLLAQGLLRTDGGGPDTPFGSRDLVRNFLKIAFYEEYADAGGRLVAQESASRLHRWIEPVTLSVSYGASMDQASRTRDSNEVTRLLRRLRKATGHPITEVNSGGNFRVFIVNEDERRAMGPKLRQIMPDISPAAINTIINLPRTTYCLVFATTRPGRSDTYEQAIAVIRAEHPDLLRASCIHEEITQGLGLANDYPLARPSIFNDDEEFGLLTTHDEKLLEMLYDKRLSPGMAEAEARPIVEQIARELTGEARLAMGGAR